MAGTVQSSVISRWRSTYLIVFFLWMCTILPGDNSLVPEGTMEKGFQPSSAWFEETSNMSMIQEEMHRHEQKENIHTAYQNHYLKYSHPKLPSPVDHWAPVTPSSLPPPLPPHYSVTVSIQQPEALVLLCQVQEPLEHISWLWYPCPNHQSPGDGTLIADGTVVSNASLYGIRIIGQNGVFISELHILQNPLQPGIAGLYRCEAWPHGANKDSTNHQTSSVYHDEFLIGGHIMVKSCFYDPHGGKYYYHHGASTYNHKLQKRYRTPRNLTVPEVSTDIIDGNSETSSTQVP